MTTSPVARREIARQSRGESAVELIDRSVRFLRGAPAVVLVHYYVGAAPFILGLLFFWADMSRGAAAGTHLLEGSLAMALLYIWMKTWQSIFAAGLRALMQFEERPVLNAARLVRVAAAQALIQPWGLFIRPMALVITVPYGFVTAFFENIVALGDDPARDLRALVSDAAAQARLWPAQNHLGLAAGVAFGIVVWANVGVALAVIPYALKIFTGIETVFTKGPWGFLNSTFVALTIALAYLCLDPVRKTFYALRCFHGESVRSGEDLKAELAKLADAAGAARSVDAMAEAK